MNAIDALKLANTRGAAAMLHARELAIRRKLVTDKIATMHPLAIVGIGLGAGTLLGKIANRHPLVASATTAIAAIIRYAPADMLMQLWEQRAGGGAAQAVADTEGSPLSTPAADANAAAAPIVEQKSPDTLAREARDEAIASASVAVGAKPAP